MKKQTETAYIYLEGDPLKKPLDPTISLPYGTVIVVVKDGKEIKVEITPVDHSDYL